jgi:hypothetical protein
MTAGGLVLFSLTGMSSLTSGSGVHVMTFQTADAAHGWLNDIIAIGEGSIDPDRGLLAMRYYVCTADFLPGIEARADQLPEARLAAREYAQCGDSAMARIL